MLVDASIYNLCGLGLLCEASMELELEHPLLAFHDSHPTFVVEAAHV